MKVISGGQTGIDQIALMVARELGMETGGWAPRGWVTEYGQAKELLQSYGLKECRTPGYPARTEANVRDSDITLIFTEDVGPGSKLTINMCVKHKKPYQICPVEVAAYEGIKTINIAGTRGSKLSADSLAKFEQSIRDILISMKESS